MKEIQFFKRSSRSKLAWAVAVAMSLGMGNLSYAQDDEGEDEEAVLEEITVTGSRIRRDDFSQAQPTTVVNRDMLDNLGIINIGDAMAQLPSNVANNTPTANPAGNFFNGANIANLRGLNPFFGSRTLTLVDSRRHVPTNQGDGVDLNFIPSILIDRMEVVTGGASASYGSGAIGGVNNILLDRDLEGGKVQIDFGTTAESDGDDLHYGFAWGSQVGDNGHFVIGIEGQDMDPIENCASARSWCAKGVDFEANAGNATNGDASQVLVGGVRQQHMSTSGVTFDFVNQTQFDTTGTTLSPYVEGTQYVDSFFDGTGVGGEGRPIYAINTLRSNVDRNVVYMNYDHQINEDMGFFIEGSFGSVETYSPQGSLDATFLFIAPDNAFTNLMATNPFPFGALINKDFSDQATTANETTTDMMRFAAGLNGRFGDTTWTWDAYYQHGESERSQSVLDNRHSTRFDLAFDAVLDVNGAPVCRAVRDGLPAGSLVDPRLVTGCVPINIFGNSNITDEAFAYSFGQLVENTDVDQDVIEVLTSGELFQGFGAGPVLAAVGASWRDESLSNISDESQPEFIRSDYLIQYGGSFVGDVEVTEVFAEVDLPFTETFNVQAAIRRSEYENSAGFGTGIEGESFDYGITTWKVNANWQITDALTLRGSQSRDIRAPNFRELYYTQVIPAGGLFGYCDNPWTGNFAAFFTTNGDPCVLDLHGGIGLQPEEADTTTLGFVLTPADWNIRFAADWYQIEIADAITPADSGLVIDGCFNGRDPLFCSQIQGTLLDPNDPLGGFSVVTQVSPEAFNFRGYESSGIDFTADWAGEFDFGTISTRVIASHVIEQIIQPSAENPSLVRDISGQTGDGGGFLADWAPSADWTAQWITTFNNGPYTVTTQARFVADGVIDVSVFGPEDAGYDPTLNSSRSTNSVPSYVVWALNGSYDFTIGNAEMAVFGSINNLFDKEPPLIGGGQGGTNATFFDTIGRNYQVGLRATF